MTDGNGNAVSPNADHIANINPIRYRGYYYDTETMFYYLQSRYYDPYLGRFLNVDGYTTTGQGFKSYNMYAYCLNNPVAFVDSEGTYATKDATYNTVGESLCGLKTTEEKKYVCGVDPVQTIDEVEPNPDNAPIDITDQLNNAMRQNAENLKDYNDNNKYLDSVGYFIDKVKPGGDWDFKSQESWALDEDKTYVYNGIELRYDDIGNIHYGYVGRVLFSEYYLLVDGGVVQIYAGTSSLSYITSNFYDPHDQWAIEYGSNLWDEEENS